MLPFRYIPSDELELKYRNCLLDLIGNKNYFNYNDIRKETYNERIKWWVQYSFHHNLIIRHIAKIWLKNINNELQIKKKKTTITSKL